MSPSKVSTTVGEDCSNLMTDWSSASVEKCTLPEDVQQVALKELREDESSRSQMLMAFRQWISKNPDVQNINMGIKFTYIIISLKYHQIWPIHYNKSV